MIKEDLTSGMVADGISGMAVDGMSGTGFTDTGNIAGIALGMHPKKKKKKRGKPVMEDIMLLIEEDLKSMAKPPKETFSGERYLVSRTYPGKSWSIDRGTYTDPNGKAIKLPKPSELPAKEPAKFSVAAPAPASARDTAAHGITDPKQRLLAIAADRAAKKEAQEQAGTTYDEPALTHAGARRSEGNRQAMISKEAKKLVKRLDGTPVEETIEESLAPVPAPMYTPLFQDARNIGTPDQAGSLGLPRAMRGIRRRAVLAAVLGGV